MRTVPSISRIAVVAVLALLPLGVMAGGAQIESADEAVTAGDTGDLTIESVDEGNAQARPSRRTPDAGTRVTLSVAAGREADDGRLPTAKQREFKLGERRTVFEDTYRIGYIEDMQLNEQGNSEPIVEEVPFGRWLDVSVDEVGEEGVNATVYFVLKRPVNVDPNASQPHMHLPEADFSMVTRQVRLNRGDSETLRISGADDVFGIRLGMPAR